MYSSEEGKSDLTKRGLWNQKQNWKNSKLKNLQKVAEKQKKHVYSINEKSLKSESFSIFSLKITYLDYFPLLLVFSKFCSTFQRGGVQQLTSSLSFFLAYLEMRSSTSFFLMASLSSPGSWQEEVEMLGRMPVVLFLQATGRLATLLSDIQNQGK